MAQIWRHYRAITAALLGLVVLAFAPALAQDQGAKQATDLFDHPVLAVDPGMHTAAIWSQAVDAAGRFAVTGSTDRTVRIWTVADGKLLRTIWIPVGPEAVGQVTAVAISQDGSTIAVGGRTERTNDDSTVYLFERESGNFIQRTGDNLPADTFSLTFSPDGRFLAAWLDARKGLRVFDRDKDWSEVFRDDQYEDTSYGTVAFARDGRLATTSYDGVIRLYRYDPASERPNFRRAGELVKAPSGRHPNGITFSPDGKRLAVGYVDVAAVDILDGITLERVGGHRPADVRASFFGFMSVAWSRDGQTLFAGGAVRDAQGKNLLFAWDRAGMGDERRMPHNCANGGVEGIDALPNGHILVASQEPCLSLMDADGKEIWTIPSPVFSVQGANNVRVSEDGEVVDFGDAESSTPMLRFNVRSLTRSSPPPSDGMTLAPLREGLTIDHWRNENNPTLNGRALPLGKEMARSLAIAPDAKHFFLGSHRMLRAFDDAGTQIWSHIVREVWAVNASQNGRIVVAAHGDGTIRWYRAVDGHELLALQVLTNKGDRAKWDWVLWTPEGFYEATQGAEDVLKWVINHGPDKATTTLPVSAIAKLHRPNALPLVLTELDTARALGIDDLTQARLEVQVRTGSAKPPGGVLHVLAIGVDTFGDKAGGLHLDYAAKDAHDVASALLESQKGSPGRASLYADVRLEYLANDEADSATILDRLDNMARNMAKNEPGQDVAVILVSSHGEMIDGQFYLIAYGFDAGSQGRSMKSAVSASEFAKKVGVLARYGKVLLLLDACHSGSVGAQVWASDPDAKVLQGAMDQENVTVLTSSKRNELSEELPDWKHGALAQAFLDALAGAADSQGIVRLSALTDAMENEVKSLTKDRQHLGMHVNFSGDLFVASHH